MNWREKIKHKLVTAEEAISHVKSGDKIAVTQAHSASCHLLQALVDRADELEDIQMLTQILYEAADVLRPAYAKGFKNADNFLTGDSRKDCERGDIDYMPMFFFELPRYYAEIQVPDVALFTLSMPDENGMCSFSLNADCAVGLAKHAKLKIAQINKYFPYTHGSYISIDEFDYVVEHHTPIIERPGTRTGPIEQAIGAHIAPMIPDGATLQMGIGGIPDAVLASLFDRKDLGVHTEMFSDGMVELYKAGVVTNERKNLDKGKMVSTFLIGTQKLFDFVDNNPVVKMMPVDYTNNPCIIAQNDNVISVNACLQVDLLGQVNAGVLNGKVFTGVGGQLDFVRGASMSKGGKSIITLPSTAAKGTVSRIVCELGHGSPVTTSRYDVHYICTEHGVVDLHGRTVKDRAKLLISIAAPEYREQLTFEAKKAGFII